MQRVYNDALAYRYTRVIRIYVYDFTVVYENATIYAHVHIVANNIVGSAFILGIK